MSLDAALKLRVFGRDGWKCRRCKSRENLTPHHILYRSRGGLDLDWNLITLCAECHRKVHDKELNVTGNSNVGVTFKT